MNITGEAITTPFTFVATTHALYWNKIRPVFCDIEPVYYSIDPDKIEALITPRTTAIVAVHVYGFPCQVDKLEQIAKNIIMHLIYDAAHAFGIKIGNKHIADFGDVSMFSFHATKLFHTFEGGMLVFKDSSLKKIFKYLSNFGFEDEETVVMPGTNAKMTEIQAVMGILMLDYIDDYYRKTKKAYCSLPGSAYRDTGYQYLPRIAGM
jgi:dTDP-4-amino-4,6-dideoxygalactose transaminase